MIPIKNAEIPVLWKEGTKLRRLEGNPRIERTIIDWVLCHYMYSPCTDCKSDGKLFKARKGEHCPMASADGEIGWKEV